MSKNDDRIKRHHDLAEHWVAPYLDGHKTQKIRHDANILKYAPNATIFTAHFGEAPHPMAKLSENVNPAELEMQTFWEHVPDLRAVRYEIYPSDEGVLLWSVFEGTVKDTPRARSLELSNKTLHFDEVDMWFTDDDFQIIRQMVVVDHNQLDALTQLCRGASAFAPGAMPRLGHGDSAAAGAERVDPDQPTKPIQPPLTWLVDGRQVPIPVE
jgi:hypothetical protein